MSNFTLDGHEDNISSFHEEMNKDIQRIVKHYDNFLGTELVMLMQANNTTLKDYQIVVKTLEDGLSEQRWISSAEDEERKPLSRIYETIYKLEGTEF
jgi:antibiotic biosynthesis monooxygenase (ABM) superfamily enzyme